MLRTLRLLIFLTNVLFALGLGGEGEPDCGESEGSSDRMLKLLLDMKVVDCDCSVLEKLRFSHLEQTHENERSVFTQSSYVLCPIDSHSMWNH